MIQCCICQERFKTTDVPFLLVHSCKESIVCFDCLIRDKWEDKYAEAWKKPVSEWWESGINCPICNSGITFTPPSSLIEHWNKGKKEFKRAKYEDLLAKFTVKESNLQVMESTLNVEKLINKKLEDKNAALMAKLEQCDEELKDYHRRVIMEMEKNNEMTARYINAKKRVQEAIDEDDDEFACIIQRRMSKKHKPGEDFTLVYPDVTKSYPLSDLFAGDLENSQSQ